MATSFFGSFYKQKTFSNNLKSRLVQEEAVSE